MDIVGENRQLLTFNCDGKLIFAFTQSVPLNGSNLVFH